MNIITDRLNIVYFFFNFNAKFIARNQLKPDNSLTSFVEFSNSAHYRNIKFYDFYNVHDKLEFNKNN